MAATLRPLCGVDLIQGTADANILREFRDAVPEDKRTKRAAGRFLTGKFPNMDDRPRIPVVNGDPVRHIK